MEILKMHTKYTRICKKIHNVILNTSARKMHWGVISTGILLAVLSGFFYYNEEPHGDATYYFNTAQIISSDFKALFTTNRIGVGESLNAIFQGFVMLLPGNDFIAVYFLQIIVYALTGLFIYKLAEQFIGRRGALFTLALYLVNHNHWVHIYNFKPGVWVNLFLILTMYYAFLVLSKPEKRKYYLLAGIFSALLLLTDLRYLPHLFFMYGIFLFSSAPFTLKIKNMSLSVILLSVIITPWIIRQSIVFERFIFISDLNSVTIHRVLNTNSYQALKDHTPSLAKLSEEEFQNRFWNLRDSLNLTPGELIYARAEAKKTILNTNSMPIKDKYNELIDNGVFTEEQINEIITKEENRPDWIKRLKLAAYLWAPFKLRYSYNYLSTYKTFIPPASLTSNLNRILTLGVLIPFLLLGLFYLIKQRNLFGITLAGIFVIHTLVHILTYVQWRYMLPVLPLITIVSVYGFMRLFNISKQHT